MMEIQKSVSAVCRKLKNNSKRPFLIAIDGRCGAGKTTLAARLKEETGCNVIHMDHFFLQPQQRTKERLQEPGGNVDYERFLEEVMVPLSGGRKFSYRIYDCKKGILSEPVPAESGEITVVEGAYSCHPRLWNFYDFHIFIDVERKEQLRRIEHRNGEEALTRFCNQWIPMEEKYFTEFQIRERCELIL